jgi:hypothetical protein
MSSRSKSCSWGRALIGGRATKHGWNQHSACKPPPLAHLQVAHVPISTVMAFAACSVCARAAPPRPRRLAERPEPALDTTQPQQLLFYDVALGFDAVYPIKRSVVPPRFGCEKREHFGAALLQGVLRLHAAAAIQAHDDPRARSRQRGGRRSFGEFDGSVSIDFGIRITRRHFF